MEQHRALIDAHVERWITALPDDPLYAPMVYLMRLPAKRVRPGLALLSCELFGGRAEDAMDEALGIELFHNFTLMHDDIMDASPLRRGHPAVHVQWGVNTAILSGDAMLLKAYQLMAGRTKVIGIFGRCALQVCEGQQRDMGFEQRNDVTLAEYTEMIRLKTAVLLSCALQVGAAVADASDEDRARIGAFGEHLGLAFQLRDDVLDAFGDPSKVGKEQGGDLRAGKKTWLLIRGLEREVQEGGTVLREALAMPADQRNVRGMISALETLGVRVEAEAEIERHNETALRSLGSVRATEERKRTLRALAALLLDRTS